MIIAARLNPIFITLNNDSPKGDIFIAQVELLRFDLQTVEVVSGVNIGIKGTGTAKVVGCVIQDDSKNIIFNYSDQKNFGMESTITTTSYAQLSSPATLSVVCEVHGQDGDTIRARITSLELNGKTRKVHLSGNKLRL